MSARLAELERLAREMAPSGAAIDEQLAFFELGAAEAALLRRVHAPLLQHQRRIVTAFYAHLQTVPALRAMLAEPQVLARLQLAQADYFRALTAGDYGAEYVRHRVRVGVVHQQIGLEPQWYIGAYRKYLSALAPVLQAVLADRPELYLPTYDALLKVVCFDMSLALNTYMQSGRRELRDSEERFRAAFGQAAVGLAELNAEGRWLRANQKLQEIVGYSEAELLAMSFRDITPAQEWRADDEQRGRLLAGEIDHYTREKRYRRKDGHTVWVKVTVALMHAGGSDATMIAVIEDIARRKQYEEELRHLASHDPLTGLANRNLMLDRLSQAIAFAHRAARHVAVMFIDLDRFKNINDSLGHDAGDQVIMEVGRRLVRNIREGDTVARVGGDEFVVLLSDVARDDEVAALAAKMLAALSLPIIVHGQELAPVGSIGISLYPRDGADSGKLLKNADAAMYRAKELGRGNFQFYAEEMNARTLDRLKLEGGLRRALQRGEFELYYQPQVELSGGRIVGMEALLRWQPPGGAMVMPAEFIPIAEETGLIVPIGEWVLRQACAQQVAWREAGLRDIRVAVNLSARQFKQPDLARLVAQVLAETGCHAECLELEITESVIMERPEEATAMLQTLSDMGVHLSIDDFGTGYSSLTYLKRFPIQSLKIDRSFVADLINDPDDAAIVCAVIALAHTMKLCVIAEGVETQAQLDYLRAQHCDQLQGYYFSRPLPAAQVAELLAAE
ncbi:putative bifunctional diguanylate cyclase/phosphodiesterase [Rugamonas sp. CCM 8940]|uniref:putative bifunctional diguanylate cyclase/phosphodiesterase n=1 Tax=Rugamonas sp. CCM 8940 TaxID=2765359 RepID=UPI0018F3D99D|nr:EAL domain-containing protein [Rugamonas sp. CCM 8940]MBJ7312254.1 EAL domain-containing protein [Rugamonas sp. CCM 8940]